MKNYLTTISKALAGALASTVTSLGTAMADGNLTRAEVIVALGAGLVVGGGLVYVAPRNVEPLSAEGDDSSRRTVWGPA